MLYFIDLTVYRLYWLSIFEVYKGHVLLYNRQRAQVSWPHTLAFDSGAAWGGVFDEHGRVA
jgi:hypothetical protein